jgi:riboflavin kinase/FMN adenylyltransferase
MRVIYGIENITPHYKKPVVTVGTFDGVHRGHRILLCRVVERAGEISGTSIVLTFTPHPGKILSHKGCPPLLTSLAHRIRLIGHLGVDVCVAIEFDRDFAQVAPEHFVEKVLCEKLRVCELLVGEDFRFGKARKGDVNLL